MTNSHLSPYLTFAGTTKEAMAFYHSVLGGKLDVSTFGEFGAPDGVDPEGVMHAQLDTDTGWTLMASDTAPGTELVAGNSVTVALFGDDEEVLRAAFTGLSEGGTVTVPLEKQVWGDEYGAFTDRFGVSWMVNLSPAAEG
ncbi:VOC family protein [Kineococcus sp. SYSU DK003]|uniref:VOC family protein n=1 Tax=Kineococcus sp. SYSU DK003 TaxID=3383124 RepID=UPI003D7CFB7F